MADRQRPKLAPTQESLAHVLKSRKARTLVGAHELPHVQTGRICEKCRHWMDPKKGAVELAAGNFWEKCFHNRDDGHDLKPQHIGHPSEYSVCKERNCASHRLSTCEKWGSL